MAVTTSQAQRLASQFATAAAVVQGRRIGSGHVNDTFEVGDAAGRRYILQRLNTMVFRQPAVVMANIVKVTSALAARVADPRRRLSLVPTRAGEAWLAVEDQCWRMYDFIADSTELTPPATLAQCAGVGQAFGEFMLELASLPGEGLQVTIPDFHNEPHYLARLKAAVAADRVGRVSQVPSEIESLLAYETVSHDFDNTAMPLRITHNDAKASNVLFDTTTGQPLAVIDLDTIQPGFVVNDFGDIIRSCATTATEDELDLDAVHFSPARFEACTRAYLAACHSVLTGSELAHLRHGARLMTLETSVRFLTDYLEGDIYYRTAHPGHNLERARNQAKLLADLDRHWDWMGEVIEAAIPRTD
ncbi:MAG: aminoglycoside phosphotransferase family protein [Propionibacteriaceae bacterium]|jgi:Ser/Thr protein kinase RdoA (MazF antagonist)|nr:aminoglycoside phosphotransferase family protein [Propionibacteriaceae bacterium]